MNLPEITILKERRIQRARFAHICHCCGNSIPKGTEYYYFFIRDDDAVPPHSFASHQHIHCSPREASEAGGPKGGAFPEAL